MKKKNSIIFVIFLGYMSSPYSLITMPSFADMFGDANMADMFGGDGGMPPFDMEEMLNDPEFQNMVNDPEFQQMMEEITQNPEFQKMVEGAEAMFKTQGAPTPPPPKAPATQTAPVPVTAQQQEKLSEDHAPEQESIASKIQSFEADFIEGMPKETQKGRKPTDNLPPHKAEALDYFVDTLVELLTEVENKLISSKKFSPTFKDIVGHFRKAIDAIKTEVGIIQDQKIYANRLLSDEFAKLRTTIVSTTKELSKLNQSIIVTEKDETATSDDDILTRRALENFDDDKDGSDQKTPHTATQDQGDFDEE